MRYRYILPLIILLPIISCRKDKYRNGPAPVPPVVVTPLPVPPVFLKDIVVSNLPSPYYHFDYTAGKISFVSFAAGFGMYDVVYNGDHISEMKNNIAVNKDRLVYSYNAAGKVDTVRYIDSAGIFYKRAYFGYNNHQLSKITWERKTGTGFLIDRTLSFSYHADGNLHESIDHRPAIPGQTEMNVTRRFTQYDNKINTDGFTLIHDESNDHLFLLPGVQLQKNNPGKFTRLGDGFSYEITYTYTYSDKNAPLTRQGQALILTGGSAGQQFQTNMTMTYY